MAKKEANIAQRHNEDANGMAQQSMVRITEDDNCLPSPAELAEYQKIDPNLIPFFMEVAKQEQEHRHHIEALQTQIVSRANKRDYRINLWGMFFAFLCVMAFAGIAFYAMFTGSVWMSILFGGGTLASVVAIFVGSKKPQQQSGKRK